MKAVILAAGLGTRMKPLTEKKPKSMIEIMGKPIMEYKLNALPESIDEIIIVIGYKGEEIKKYFGNFYNGKKIRYVADQTLSGTAHALWQAKEHLSERFLVMMGDDIYSPASLSECAKYDWSICCKPSEAGEDGSRAVLDENGKLADFVTADAYRKMGRASKDGAAGPRHDPAGSHDFAKSDEGLIFTGLYSMTDEIFKYDPVKMKTKEEWSLPQTLLLAAKDHELEIIKTDFWISISTPEDLKMAEIELKKALLNGLKK